jgi:hypothetical protein
VIQPIQEPGKKLPEIVVDSARGQGESASLLLGPDRDDKGDPSTQKKVLSCDRLSVVPEP